MKTHLGVSVENLLNPLGPVDRRIVRKEMNLHAARLISDQAGEEGRKLVADMTLGHFTHRYATTGVKSSVQQRGVVTEVLKAVALRPPPGENGRTESSRSGTWMAVFSSTRSTAT